MKLVLLRHATRSAFDMESGPAGESPLNAVGLAQAEDLLNHLSPKGPLPQPTRLFVSPKLRARQTLTPLARESAVKLEIETRLDERNSGESVRDFNDRIKDLFEDLNNTADESAVIYLCSHMDWLEAVTTLWPSNMSEREASMPWSPLEYQVFRLREGVLHTLARGHVSPRF